MMCTVGIPSALVLESCVNPWPSKHSHLYQEASEYLRKSTSLKILPNLSNPVSNGKKVLYGLECEGSGLVGESV